MCTIASHFVSIIAFFTSRLSKYCLPQKWILQKSCQRDVLLAVDLHLDLRDLVMRPDLEELGYVEDDRK